MVVNSMSDSASSEDVKETQAKKKVWEMEQVLIIKKCY